MPEQEVKYTIKIGKEGSGATQAQEDLKKVDQQAKSTNDSLGGLTAGFGKLFAALGGIALLSESVKQFVEAERAMSKLRVALSSAGDASTELLEKFAKLAETIGNQTGIEGSAIVNVMAKLTSFGARPQDLERLTRLTLDLSVVMDKDLGRATVAIGSALKGDFSIFKQFGVIIDETRTVTKQLTEGMNGLTKALGGQAVEAAKTLGGQFDQLKKKLNEMKETLGGITLGALTGLGILKEPGGTTNAPWLNPPAAGAGKPKINFDALGMPSVAQAGANADAFKFLPRYTPGQNDIETAATAKADSEAAQKSVEAWGEATAKKMAAELEALDKIEKERDRLAQKRMDAEDRANDFEKDLRDDALLGSLEGVERERAQLQVNHEQRQRQIRELTQDDKERYAELMVLEDELHGVETARFEQAQTMGGKLELDMQRIAVTGQEAFAGGLAGAIVDAFEEGDKAFQKFAVSFLKLMAQMILQAIILRIVQGAVGSLFGGGTTPGTAGGVHAAHGGQFRALAGGGMAETNGPVTMPRFGVLAGEAGRELLTVMAQPRSVNFNGLSARVGNVGGRAMAITDANELSRAGGGAGGTIVIQLSHSPETEARIVRNSVRGAQVQITQDLGQDTPVSRGVKRVAT